MKTHMIARITCLISVLIMAACGGGSPSGPYQGTEDTGGGGTASYLSDFRAATDRALLRKHRARHGSYQREDQNQTKSVSHLLLLTGNLDCH